jgi:hypothetical protein
MKILRTIFYILVVAIMMFFVVRIFSGSEGSGAYVGLVLGIALMVGCALIWLVSAIARVVLAPKESMRSMLGFAGMALIVLISWALGTNEIVDGYLKVGFDSASASKWVSAGLNTMYAIGGLCIAAIILSEIRSTFFLKRS